MNQDETKIYIDKRLSRLGWPVHLDRPGYVMIHQFTRGLEGRLNQLYDKVVAISSLHSKREINNDVVESAIDELARMAEMLEKASKQNRSNNDQDNDRLSIEHLANQLETGAASILNSGRNAAATNATAKPRGNGAQETARKAVGTGALPKILIVDDSPTIRAVVNKALGNNFSILQASDGEEAWDRLLTNNDIELVVTDLMMPKLDGYGLINRIRSDKSASHLDGLPIIVVTTIEDADAKLRALVCGANDFITKSTDAVELQARVLARHKLAQSLKETARRKTSSWQPNPATPPNPANTSVSPSAMHAASSSKPSAKTSAPGDPWKNNKVAAGSKPATGKPEGQRPTLRGFVNPVTPGRDRPALDKLNQHRPIATKPISRFSSTVTVTLIATLIVVFIVASIVHLNKSEPTTEEQPVESVQTDVSVVKGRVDSEQQQQLTTPGAPPDLSSPASDSSLASVAQKDLPGVANKKDIADTKEKDRSIVAGQDGSPEKTASSRLDKAVIPAAPEGPLQTSKLPGRPAAAAFPKNTVVATVKPTRPLPPPEKQNPEKSSTRVAATVPATNNPVASAQPSQTLPPSDVPTSALPPPQTGTDVSSSATLARNKVDTNIVAIAPVSASSQVSQAELVTLLKKFVFVYEAGDIVQFLNLFDKDVRTNDRTTKAGLREDYEGLFKTTDMRQMILGNVTWEVNNNQADGWGNFEVKVRKTGEGQTKVFKGSLTLHVEKLDGRLLIKHLYHGQWRSGAG